MPLTVINGPSAPPAPQQLVVAQCAMQTNKDLILGPHNKPITELKDHHVCVAAHTPVWYDRAGLHSDRINKDVIEVSGCASVVRPPTYRYDNMNTDNEDKVLDYMRKTTYSKLSLQPLGIAQSAISNGSDVRNTPEAMGRLGVAIGGLVSVAVPKESMTSSNAKIGDYVYLTTDYSRAGYTISGAPTGLQCIHLEAQPNRQNGRPHAYVVNSYGKGCIKGSAIGRIFQFGPGPDEVQVLLC